MYGMKHFRASNNKPYNKLEPNNQLKRIGTAVIMLYVCKTKPKVRYFDL